MRAELSLPRSLTSHVRGPDHSDDLPSETCGACGCGLCPLQAPHAKPSISDAKQSKTVPFATDSMQFWLRGQPYVQSEDYAQYPFDPPLSDDGERGAQDLAEEIKSFAQRHDAGSM